MILEMMPKVKVGDPLDPETQIGPLKVKRTRKLLDRALEALGEADFLVQPRRDGVWQGPFLVETPESPDLELFGPFLTLTKVESGATLVERALRSRYPFLVTYFGTATQALAQP